MDFHIFSVGMMFDLGLEQTGRFETVVCIDKEKAFCNTVRHINSKGRLLNKLKLLEGRRYFTVWINSYSRRIIG